MPGARSVVAGVLALLVVAAPAFAAKTGKVTLFNGDAFTCEIKVLGRGKLVVSTDDAGTLSVEWTKVATNTSRSTLQFEYQRPFRSRWGVVMLGGFERNKDLGFVLRSTRGGHVHQP